jgi:hypothetical protein
MIRMPPYLDNCTSRFARTTRCDGHAIYHYPTPITRRFFNALMDYGTVLMIGVALAAGLVYGWSLP